MSVPTGYDPVTLNHWLWWKIKCFEASGEEFQRLFERVMSKLDPDFIAVRPYGSMGDLKNDGMLRHAGVVHQVYSPDEFKQADLVNKIQEDLDGAVTNWGDGLKRWVFVYNVRRGLPPDVARTLTSLRSRHPNVALDHVSSDHLWDRLRALPLQDRCEILGAPAGYEHLFLAGEIGGETTQRLKNGAFVVIQDVLSPISLVGALEALKPRETFGPPLRVRPDVRDEAWLAAAAFQRHLVDEAIERARTLLPRFAVFSLAPIPLVIHLGFLLSDRVEVQAFQYDRDRKSWSWPGIGAGEGPGIVTTVDEEGTDDAVIRVSLSAPVAVADVEPHVPRPRVSVHVSVPNPDVMWLRTAEQVAHFAPAFREALLQARQARPIGRVHVFFAGPTPAALALGQAVNPRMNPPILLYEFSWQRNPRYRHVLTLREGA